MNRYAALAATPLLVLGCSSSDSGASSAAAPCRTDAPGVICTIAGTGENGYSGDDGPALQARLSLPQDTLTASDGTMYLIDWNNHRIRAVGPNGVMRAVAGRGELGDGTDSPDNSDFNHPTGIIFDAEERHLLVAAWHNSKVRTIDLETLEIEDTCGDGRRAYFGDEGPANTAALDLPASVALAPSGDLVIMDQANQVLRRVDADGVIHRMAGQCVVDRLPPDGPGPCAEGRVPDACPGTLAGKTSCGNLDTDCAKPCTPGYGGDDGHALGIRLAQPFGQSADPGGRMVFDADGNLFFADTSNAILRKLDVEGRVTRIAGLAPVGGRPQFGHSGDDGPALEARLYNPVDLALASDGTLYFSDVYNHCIRAVDPDGIMRHVAGVCGQPGYSGDGGPATEARMTRPYGIEWTDGSLIVSDTGNNVIRKFRLH